MKLSSFFKSISNWGLSLNIRMLSITLVLGLLYCDVKAAVPTLEQAQQISARTGRPILIMAGADT